MVRFRNIVLSCVCIVYVIMWFMPVYAHDVLSVLSAGVLNMIARVFRKHVKAGVS